MGFEQTPTVSLDPDNPADSAKIAIVSNEGEPYDGQGNGVFGKGSIYINQTSGLAYSNTGTKADPVWTAMSG